MNRPLSLPPNFSSLDIESIAIVNGCWALVAPF